MMSRRGQTGQQAGGAPSEGASSAEAAAAVVRHARDVGRLGKAGGQDAHALQQLPGHLPPLVRLCPAHASSASAPCPRWQLAPATPETQPLAPTSHRAFLQYFHHLFQHRAIYDTHRTICGYPVSRQAQAAMRGGRPQVMFSAPSGGVGQHGDAHEVAPLVLQIHGRALRDDAVAELLDVGPLAPAALLHSQHQCLRLLDAPAQPALYSPAQCRLSQRGFRRVGLAPAQTTAQCSSS